MVADHACGPLASHVVSSLFLLKDLKKVTTLGIHALAGSLGAFCAGWATDRFLAGWGVGRLIDEKGYATTFTVFGFAALVGSGTASLLWRRGPGGPPAGPAPL